MDHDFENFKNAFKVCKKVILLTIGIPRFQFPVNITNSTQEVTDAMVSITSFITPPFVYGGQ